MTDSEKIFQFYSSFNRKERKGIISTLKSYTKSIEEITMFWNRMKKGDYNINLDEEIIKTVLLRLHSFGEEKNIDKGICGFINYSYKNKTTKQIYLITQLIFSDEKYENGYFVDNTLYHAIGYDSLSAVEIHNMGDVTNMFDSIYSRRYNCTLDFLKFITNVTVYDIISSYIRHYMKILDGE